MDSTYKYSRAWKLRNPDKVLEQTARYRAKNPDRIREINAKCRASHSLERSIRAAGERASSRKYISGYKIGKSCQICGESEPVCLDFHHKDKTQKEYTISQMTRYSISTIQKEIEKCIIVCANCHRKIHSKIITP